MANVRSIRNVSKKSICVWHGVLPVEMLESSVTKAFVDVASDTRLGLVTDEFAVNQQGNAWIMQLWIHVARMKKPVPDIWDSHICDGDRGFCHFAPIIIVPDIASKRGDTPGQ